MGKPLRNNGRVSVSATVVMAGAVLTGAAAGSIVQRMLRIGAKLGKDDGEALTQAEPGR